LEHRLCGRLLPAVREKSVQPTCSHRKFSVTYTHKEIDQCQRYQPACIAGFKFKMRHCVTVISASAVLALTIIDRFGSALIASMRGNTLRRLAAQASSQIYKVRELPARVTTPQTQVWTPVQMPVNSGTYRFRGRALLTLSR